MGVRRPWRRKGIALALLHHSFGECWRRGKKRVMLGVDTDSLTGAVDLYKKAGMYIHHQTDLYELELRPGREFSKTGLDV
jgi:GNAT superfamily N-acetyltransferase